MFLFISQTGFVKGQKGIDKAQRSMLTGDMKGSAPVKRKKKNTEGIYREDKKKPGSQEMQSETGDQGNDKADR